MADQQQLHDRTGLRRTFRDSGDGTHAEEYGSQLRGWDATSLTWVKLVVDHASGALSTAAGGGGGAVTIADGANVAQGTTTDLSSANTLVGLLKAIKASLAASLTVTGSLGRTWTLASGTDSISAVQSTAAAAGSPWSVRLSDGAAFYTGAKDSTLTDGTQRGSMKLLDTAGTNAAAVSAAGRLSVDASGVAVPITDNSGSLTVDAPVGTPVFVRLSDGAAALVGQKAMASSLPVVVASDQSAVPVSGTVTANQGTAAAVASAWPTKVTDGTNTMPTGDVVGRAILHKVTDGTNTATVKASATPPASTDSALVVDLRRTPSEGTALSSASHAVGTFTFDIADTTGYTGVAIVTDLTVLGVSSTVTNTIQVKDPVTAKFTSATAAAFTAVSSVSTTRQAMHPANTGASGNLQGGVMTKAVRVSSVVAVAASTYSIGYSLTP